VLLIDDLHTAIAKLQGISLVKKTEAVLVFAKLNNAENTWLQRGGLALPSMVRQSKQQLVLQLLQ
jgi:hypothetical protein